MITEFGLDRTGNLIFLKGKQGGFKLGDHVPPGHHAESNKALGFCFFNNIALGAKYLLENYGLERVAIIDWDVHHGNGTQHLFESDPRVFFLSLHEDPSSCFPGTGRRREAGKGKGKGKGKKKKD